MSIHLHSHLAVVWAVLILSEWCLACAASYQWMWEGKIPKAFLVYLYWVALRDITLFTLSASNTHPTEVTTLGKLYLWVFWIGQYAGHVLALAAVAACVVPWIRQRDRLPTSATTMSWMSAAALVGTYLAFRTLHSQPASSALIYVESGAELFVLGVVCFCSAYCVRKGGCEDGILWGFFIAYATGTALYAMRVFAWNLCALLYPADIAGAFAAVLWWIYTLRRKHATT